MADKSILTFGLLHSGLEYSLFSVYSLKPPCYNLSNSKRTVLEINIFIYFDVSSPVKLIHVD